MIEADPIMRSAGLVIAGDPPGLDELIAHAHELTLKDSDADHYLDIATQLFVRATGIAPFGTGHHDPSPSGSLPVGDTGPADLTEHDTEPLPPGFTTPPGLPVDENDL